MTDTAPDFKAIFVEALDLASDAERAAYLERACAGLPDVQARVEALLAAIGQAGSFLEIPALALEASGDPRAGAVASTLTAEADSGDAPADLSAPSTPTRVRGLGLVPRPGPGAAGGGVAAGAGGP